MTRAIAACLAALVLVGVIGLSTAGARTAQHRTHPATENVRCRKGHRHKHKRRCSHKRHVRHNTSSQSGAESSHPTQSGSQNPPPGGGTTTTPPKTLAHLQVIEREYSVIPSRTTVTAGTVAVELDNRGEDPHNLRVERADSSVAPFDFDLAKPGSISTQKLDLGPGTWKLYCTLPGHDALGMHALITVSG